MKNKSYVIDNFYIVACYDDELDVFIDLLSGEILDEKKTMLIKNRLGRKKLELKKITLEIYKLDKNKKLFGYRYVINGTNYYFDKNKRSFTFDEIHSIKMSIIKGNIKESRVW